MNTNRKEEIAKSLASLIDIAIASIETFPPLEFTVDSINLFKNSYLTFKSLLPSCNRIKSLKSIEVDVLTYFNEATGKTVEYFWQEVATNGLPYIRKDKLAKVLSRGKINSRNEYDLVIDLVIPYYQSGLIDESGKQLLYSMVDNFEKRKSSNK